MNAALLNSSRTINAGPFVEDVEPVTVEAVSGGVVVTNPPTRATSLNLDKATQWWKSAQKLDSASKPSGMNLDPGQLLAAAAAGAAAGAGIAGVGAVAGAIVMVGIAVVRAIISANNNSQWNNAGPGVHYFFTNYAPQDFQAYVEANDLRAMYSSVQDSAKGLLTWWLTVAPQPFVPTWNVSIYGRAASMDYIRDASGVTAEGQAGADQLNAWARQFYANLGVDWDATNADASVHGWSGAFYMKNRAFIDDNGDTLPDVYASTFDGGVLLLGIAATGAILALSKQPHKPH